MRFFVQGNCSTVLSELKSSSVELEVAFGCAVAEDSHKNTTLVLVVVSGKIDEKVD